MSKQNDNDNINNSRQTLSDERHEHLEADSDSLNSTNNSHSFADADIDDYIFLSSHKKKKKVKHHADFSAYNDEIIVRSNTNNRRDKKNHRKHHKRHHSRSKMKRWKKILIASVSALLAFVILSVGIVAYLIFRGSQELFNSDISISAPNGITVQEDGRYVVYNGDTYKYNEKVTSILCMGIDKRSMENDALEVNGTGGQADAIILISVDTSTGKITLINISRDTMAEVTVYSAGGSYLNTQKQQICLSYAYGDGKNFSCENTVSSVKKLFYNIPINTYFSLDLDGIAAINDSVGGVDVVSPETIDQFIAGQSYHLVGEEAEKFVRTRDTSKLDSNNMRMQRQQVYVQSFFNKVIEQTKSNISTPLTLFNESSAYSCTNLNPSKVCYLGGTAVMNGSMSIDMISVPGEVKMGEKYAEFIVNEKKFYELFLSIYYTKM